MNMKRCIIFISSFNFKHEFVESNNDFYSNLYIRNNQLFYRNTFIFYKKYHDIKEFFNLYFFEISNYVGKKSSRSDTKMLNEVLKSIRLFHKLSQTDLANSIDVTKSQISEIEAGKKNVSRKILEKYSKKFDIPISSIFLLNEQLENREFSPKVSQKIIDIFKWISSEDEEIPNNSERIINKEYKTLKSNSIIV